MLLKSSLPPDLINSRGTSMGRRAGTSVPAARRGFDCQGNYRNYTRSKVERRKEKVRTKLDGFAFLLRVQRRVERGFDAFVGRLGDEAAVDEDAGRAVNADVVAVLLVALHFGGEAV